MTIKRRLVLLLATPLVALSLLGAVTFSETLQLQRQVRFVAETQVESLATIGRIVRTLSARRINLRNCMVSKDPNQCAQAREAFELDREGLSGLLRLYSDRLVTGEEDARLLSEMQELSGQWNTRAVGVLTELDMGRREQATQKLEEMSPLGERLEKLSEEWTKLNEVLARNAGSELLKSLEASRRLLLASAIGVLVLTGALGAVVVRGISRPIDLLRQSVETVASGDFKSAVPFTKSVDELGALARSVDVLKTGAGAMEQQRWVKLNAARVVGGLQEAATVLEFGRKLAAELTPLLGGGISGVYEVRPGAGSIVRIASFGLNAETEAAPTPPSRLDQGLVGECITAAAPAVLTGLPPEYLRIGSGLGSAMPTFACAWPLVVQGAAVAAFEYASFHEPGPRERALVEEVLPVAAITLDRLNRNLRTQELLAETQKQSEAMKAQQESLRASEEQFRTLLEATPDALIISDQDGKIVLVNAQTERLLGYTRGELLGQSVDMLVPQRFRGAHPGRRLQYHQTASVRPMGTGMELSAVRKDGTEFAVEISLSPLKRPGDNGSFVCSSMRDISERKQLERKVRESEEQNRLILESSSEGIFGCDTQGRITFVNPSACRMLGFTDQELIGHPSHALIHHHRADGSAYPVEECPMYAAYKRGQSSRIDTELLWRKDGTGIPVEYGATPISKDGVVIGAVVSFTDITERKRQQAELLTQHSALEAAANAIVITDRRGVIQWVNPAFERLTGYSRGEAVGQNPRVLNSGVETPEFFQSLWKTVLAGEVWHGTLTNRRKDGVLYKEEMTITPVRSGGTEITHFVAVKQDITERRRAEAEIKRINFLSDFALDLTKAGYWHVPLDNSGWYISSERAERIFGDHHTPDYRHSLDEWAKHVKEGDEAAAKVTAQNFEDAIAGRVPVYDAIYAYKRPVDGRVVWIHALGHVAKDASGKPTDMYGVTQDITAFKLLEADLRQSKQKAEEATVAKSSFLANMSHEIRTPMNGIMGMTELALDTELSAEQRDYLNTVKSSADALLSILNDILDFSKIEAGKIELDPVEFLLRDSMGDTLSPLALRASSKGVELAYDVDPAVPDAVVGDVYRLRQVIVNLVGNAIKFTEKGEVVLSAKLIERSGDNLIVEFSVRDTGIGITPEAASRLFRAFEQAETSTTRKYGGTGLGLAISKQLVELMGGQIKLDSSPGVGSTFSFNVRLKAGTPRQMASAEDAASLFAGKTALIVDDNMTNRRILATMLGHWGLKTVEADAGNAALAVLDRLASAGQPAALVITDLHMPEMDGFELVQTLRAHPLFGRVPAMLLTSSASSGDTARCAELGIAARLLKPVKQSLLLDNMMRVLSGAERRGAAAAMPAAGPGAGQAAKVGPLKVLLAEDNPVNQKFAIRVLEGAGHTVTVANNGREAVDRSAEQSFGVILMDVQMPEMDGLEATRAIRTREASNGGRTPIIAMTANAMKGDREMCIEAGMDGYVPKPVKKDVLFAELERVLNAGGAST